MAIKTFNEYVTEKNIQNESFKTFAGAAALGLGLAANTIAGAKLLGVGNFAPQSQEAPATPTTPTVAPQQQPTIQPQTTPTPKKQETQKEKQSTIHHDVIKNMVIEDEGIRTKMYKDTKGIATIGIGHNLQASNSESAFTKAFGNQGSSLRQHALRGGSLSEDQARKLFDADYEHHLQQALKLTPNLAEHHPLVQASIVSGTYRGHWGGSPKARQLFDQGDYRGAARELLNNREYREAKARKNNIGVDERMERDAKHIETYGHVGNTNAQ